MDTNATDNAEQVESVDASQHNEDTPIEKDADALPDVGGESCGKSTAPLQNIIELPKNKRTDKGKDVIVLPDSGGAGFAPLMTIIDHPKNARTVYPKLSAPSEVELRASILAEGLIQPIVVVVLPEGLGALAGERRRRNLYYLAERGVISWQQNIPILQREEKEHAERTSHAENTNRLPMQDWEVFEHIAKRAKDGQSVDEIAKDMGRALKDIKWLLRLGKLHRSIFSALKKGNINLDMAQAYALTDDTKKQKRIWDQFGKDGIAWRVRDAVRCDSIDSSSPIAQFVTLDAYIKEGGATAEELLDDRIALLDVDLLNNLARAKLDAAAKDLGDDWGWMEVGLPDEMTNQFSYNPVIATDSNGAPEKLLKRHADLTARYEEVDQWVDEFYENDDDVQDEKRAELAAKETELEKLRDEVDKSEASIGKYTTFVEYGKPFSGCKVSFDREGVLSIQAGILRDSKAVKKYEQAAKNVKSGLDPNATEQEAKPSATDNDGEKESGRSQAFERDLGMYVRAGLRVGITEDPCLARDILEFHLCSRAFCDTGYLNLTGTIVSDKRERPDGDVCEAERRMEELWKALPLKWASEPDESKRFNTFRMLEPDDRASLIAWVVGSRLDVGHRTSGYGALPKSIRGAIKVDQTRLWRPTAETYFNRCDLATLTAHGVEWYGKEFEGEVAKMNGARKKQLAQRFSDIFVGDESGLSKKDQKIRASWLPAEFHD